MRYPTLRKEREGWGTQDLGTQGFGVAEIFMDFNAIQVTIAVMAQALIDGRIDCKTAGRLAMELQTASKLLWLQQNAARKWKTQSRPEQAGSGTSQNVFAGQNRTELSRTEQHNSGISSSGRSQNVGSVLVGHAQNVFEELKPDFLSSSGEGLNADLICGLKDRVGLKPVFCTKECVGSKPVQIRLRGSPAHRWRDSEKAA